MEQNLHIDMDIKEVSKLAFERIMKQKRIFFSSQECIDYLKALPSRKGNILSQEKGMISTPDPLSHRHTEHHQANPTSDMQTRVHT